MRKPRAEPYNRITLFNKAGRFRISEKEILWDSRPLFPRRSLSFSSIEAQRLMSEEQRKQIAVLEARLATHQRSEERLEARLAALEKQSMDR